MVQNVPDDNKQPPTDPLNGATEDDAESLSTDDNNMIEELPKPATSVALSPEDTGTRAEASSPTTDISSDGNKADNMPATADSPSSDDDKGENTTATTTRPPQDDHNDDKPPSVKAVEDDAPTQEQASGTLHLLSYLLWEREGIKTFETARAQLLDTLTRLMEQLRASTDAVEQLKHVILGGQTVLIEDIAGVRSDLIALLSIYNAGGRFGIGPWYVQVDTLLVSGESLIRNLLLGRADVTRHGVDLMTVSFMPSLVDHDGQLPQILSGFDISAVLVTAPQPVMSLPFRWVAPDGSHVLVVSHHDGEGIEKTIENQKFGQPDGPFLWLNVIETPENMLVPDVSDTVKVPTLQSTLSDYFQALRKRLPDAFRPALRGELKVLGPGYHAGRLSTRLYLKQENYQLQNLLTYQTEPWLAIALTNGNLASAANLRALLDYSWRELMKNQSRNNLTGSSHDTVTQETEIRNLRIRDVTQRIQDMSLDALPGTLTRTSSPEARQAITDETYIGVWNSHSFTVDQVVEVSLILPDGKYPDRLTDSENGNLDYSWVIDETDSDYTGRIGFRATVGSVGYAVYTLTLGDEKPSDMTVTTKGKTIANRTGETLLVEKGQLVWSRGGKRFTDFLSFYDGGDAGDTVNYQKPQPDVVVRAGMTDMVNVESTATYERLIFRERMRIAPELKDDLSRTRGLSLLDITTTATFYDGIPGIYFRTTLTNKAKDHRLRAHFQTNMKADSIVTDSSFGMTKRNITKDSTQIATLPQVNIFPLQSVAGISDETETLLLMTRGLTEIEAVMDKEDVTLALTLLRAVGWLKRDDESSHSIPAKGAQYERDIVVEYAILPIAGNDPAEMLRAGQAYSSPLQVFQYYEKPDPIKKSYLTFSNDKAIMTALKPPQTGDGWIVRLINPTDTEVTGTLTTFVPLASAKLVNLAEEDKAEYTIHNNNTINLNIGPHKIHTLRLEFGKQKKQEDA